MKKQSKFVHGIECSLVQNTAGLYLIEERFGYNVYYFDATFLHLVRYAMSTDCVSEMSDAQLALYTTFITNILNNIYNEATEALGDTLYRITSCMPVTDGVECGFSVDHTYTACV